MPNANGRIYIDSSTTPHKGVEIADIQQVLGTSDNTIGLLCADKTWDDTQNPPVLVDANRVNKWARYKPVIHPGMDTYDQLEEDETNHRMVWKASADWWRGLTGVGATCGLTIPAYAGVGSVVGTDDIWEYTRPDGTIPSQPFRFLDFNQYNHNAQKPFTLTISTDGVLDSLSATTARLYMWPASSLPEDNLLLSDIGNFESYYFGIVVSNGVQAYIKTNAYNLASGQGGEPISLAGCPLIQSAGDYDLYAVLVPVAQTTWSNTYDRAVWSLNSEDGYGHRIVTIVARAENIYKIAVHGLTIEDKRMCWLKRGNITASLVSGNIEGTDTQLNDMSKAYTLQGVAWSVVRHSDSAEVRTGSVPASQAVPQSLPQTRTGSATQFRAPFNVGTLPDLDPSDYYTITFTFTYA